MPQKGIGLGKKDYYRDHKTRAKIHDALRYGWHNGIFGADLKALAEEGYDYVGHSTAAKTWYMALVDENIDKDYHRTDLCDEEKGCMKACHFLTSENAFKSPKKDRPGIRRVKGRSLKIDPRYPGANLYVLPQIMKRSKYVPPRVYFGVLDENERINYRTKPVRWKNDWMRWDLNDRMYGYDENFRPLGFMTEEEYEEKMRLTRIGDVKNPPVGRTGYTRDDILAYENKIGRAHV